MVPSSNHNSKLPDPAASLIAIRFHESMPNMTERYYMVSNKDGSKPRLEIVHHALEPEEFAEAIPDLINHVGFFKILGFTNNSLMLGTKRNGTVMLEKIDEYIETLFKKETRMQIVVNQYSNDKITYEEMEEKITALEAISEEDYQEVTKDSKKEIRNSMLQTISEEEAFALRDNYFNSTKDDEQYIREEYAKALIADRAATKGIKFTKD